MIFPEQLRKGDSIAIISPASKIDGKLIDGACRTIESWGFKPVQSEFCKGECGSYSGTLGQRLGDLQKALADKSVRAILCSRGGYGAVHMLQHMEAEM